MAKRRAYLYSLWVGSAALLVALVALMPTHKHVYAQTNPSVSVGANPEPLSPSNELTETATQVVEVTAFVLPATPEEIATEERREQEPVINLILVLGNILNAGSAVPPPGIID